MGRLSRRDVLPVGFFVVLSVLASTAEGFVTPSVRSFSVLKRPDARSSVPTLKQSKGDDGFGPSLIDAARPLLNAPAGRTMFMKSDDTTSVPHDSIYRSAIERTLLWVSLAILFGGGLWFGIGPQVGEEFFAGYLVEQSLSVDNLFVFLLLFEFFKVPLRYQDKVLNWGIYGAIVMRAIVIGVGAAALESYRGILLVFAGILIYSSANALIPGDDDEEEDLNENAIVQFSRKVFDSTDKFDENKFFTIVDGVRKATPLFICMIAVELSDVVFAVDSIPAVFGVTENPLVVFSSNMFAIMGLRSLYTILSKAATDLKYLEPAVAVVLGFIGSKMVAEYFGYKIPTEVALTVVASLLATGIGASVYEQKQALEESSSSSDS